MYNKEAANPRLGNNWFIGQTTDFQFKCYLSFQQINLAISNVLCKEDKSQENGDVWHMQLETVFVEVFFVLSEIISSNVYLSPEKQLLLLIS